MKFQDMQNLKKVTESLENVFKELQWSDTEKYLDKFFESNVCIPKGQTREFTWKESK